MLDQIADESSSINRSEIIGLGTNNKNKSLDVVAE